MEWLRPEKAKTLAALDSATLQVVAKRRMRWKASRGLPAMSVDVTPLELYRL